jgi:hypothetical protein
MNVCRDKLRSCITRCRESSHRPEKILFRNGDLNFLGFGWVMAVGWEGLWVVHFGERIDIGSLASLGGILEQEGRLGSGSPGTRRSEAGQHKPHGFGWRIHCGVQVTILSTNKHLSLYDPA